MKTPKVHCQALAGMIFLFAAATAAAQATGQPNLPGFPPAGFPTTAPGTPIFNTATDISAEDIVSKSCAPIGGEWREDTPADVSEILNKSKQVTSKRVENCNVRPDNAEMCKRQVTTEQSIAAYFQSMMYWQCNIAVIRTAENHTVDMVQTARDDACEIQDFMFDLKETVNSNGGNMPFSPHEMMAAQFELTELCNFCRAPDITDLTELVREKQRQAELKLQEYLNADQECTDSGQLKPEMFVPGHTSTRLSDAVLLQQLTTILATGFPIGIANADGPDSAVSAEEGPFAGRKFGTVRTNELVFKEVHIIRAIQDEMSIHGGRDSLLNQHRWSKFENDVARALEAMKIDDNSQAAFMFESGLKTILETRDALNDRKIELESLKQKLDAELAAEKYTAFLTSLEALLKKNRELEDPTSSSHDASYALIALTIRNIVRVAKKTRTQLASKPYGGMVVTTLLTCVGIGANAYEYLQWSGNSSNFEQFKKPYLELIDLSSSLTLLIEQYRLRIEAQELLITKLSDEYDKEMRRRRACRKKN